MDFQDSCVGVEVRAQRRREKTGARRPVFPTRAMAALFLFAIVVCVSGLAEGSSRWGMASGGKSGAESAELEEAKSDYQLYCASCHGERGDGKGQLAAALDPPPRNHTDAKIMSSRTDEQLFKAISEGGKAVGLSESMPSHKTVLSEAKIRGLVKYLRVLCGCSHTE